MNSSTNKVGKYKECCIILSIPFIYNEILLIIQGMMNTEMFWTFLDALVCQL